MQNFLIEGEGGANTRFAPTGGNSVGANTMSFDAVEATRRVSLVGAKTMSFRFSRGKAKGTICRFGLNLVFALPSSPLTILSFGGEKGRECSQRLS